MKAWELVKKAGGFDEDTYDDEYDAIIPVRIELDNEQDEDPYFQFVVGLLKLVEVTDADESVWKWSLLVEENYDVFREFAQYHWNTYLDSQDDFIEQWLGEIYLLFAGYGSDSTYKLLVDKLLSNL